MRFCSFAILLKLEYSPGNEDTDLVTLTINLYGIVGK